MIFKKVYSDYVDLSIGRVYIKPINTGIKDKVYIKSTITGSTLNNFLFFYLWARYLVCLSNRKMAKLSLEDGEKVNTTIKLILTRHGIIGEEKSEIPQDENIFSRAEKAAFGQMKDRGLANAKAKLVG